jgi:hypothetical protein
MKSVVCALVVVASTTGLGGCFAVSNLDRFEKSSDPAPGSTSTSPVSTMTTPIPDKPTISPYRDLRLTLLNMKPHGAQTFEFRVVSDDNQIVSMGRVLPLGVHSSDGGMTVDSVVLYMANAVPRQGLLRLDFYSDVNGSGNYDGIGDIKDKKDHAWRIAPLNGLDPSFGTTTDQVIDVSYTHNMIFTDLDTVDGQVNPAKITGADATMRLTNMGAFVGKLVELRVIERATGHATALCRYPALTDAEMVVTLPGVLDPGVDYDIDMYADSNGDYAYQPTGTSDGDGGWRLGVTAGEVGFDVSLDPGTLPVQTGILFTY